MDLFSTIDFPDNPFALGMSSIFAQFPRAAISTFEPNLNNYMNLYSISSDGITLDQSISTLYPISRIKFRPDCVGMETDQFLTIDKQLKVYTIDSCRDISSIEFEEESSPITSVDWFLHRQNMIAYGGSDGSVSIVDVAQNETVSHLFAHQHPIYDISVTANSSCFITVSYDGSMRLFDVRDLDSALLLYQSSKPLIRGQASLFDHEILAALPYKSNTVLICDIRQPGSASGLITGNDEIDVFGWSHTSNQSLFFTEKSGKIYNCDLSKDAFRHSADVVIDSSDRVSNVDIGNVYIAVALEQSVRIYRTRRTHKL